jgi:hypothetical protein
MRLEPWILACAAACVLTSISARHTHDGTTWTLGVSASLLFWVAMMLLMLAERDRRDR